MRKCSTMTVSKLETVENAPISGIRDVRLFVERHWDVEDIVDALSDKRVIAAWLVRFYAAFQDLYRHVWRQEVMLRQLTPPKIPEEEVERLESAIAASRSILDLKDGFDGRGSPHYSESVWQRAAQFLRLQWEEHVRLFGEPLPLPEILAGPNGSIDVFWETPEFDLLVNVPADPKKEAEFSGDSHGKRKFDGTLDPARPNRGLVSWLAK